MIAQLEPNNGTSLAALDPIVRRLSDTHAALVAEVNALETEIEACKRARMPRLRELVARLKERQSATVAQIKICAPCFTIPRTMQLHGWKIGFRKQPGQIVVEDEAAVVARLEKLLAAEADQYLRITKKLDRKALGKLPAAQLGRLGVELRADTDAVVCEPTTGDVEKLVAAWLRDTKEP